jgi:hypothetical protein
MSGLLMAIRLKQVSFDNVRILEKAPALGEKVDAETRLIKLSGSDKSQLLLKKVYRLLRKLFTVSSGAVQCRLTSSSGKS